MMKYIQITDKGNLPDINYLKAFKCLIIISENVSQTRQGEISHWLVKSGCLIVCAWGINCSSWDDSVDDANIELCNYSPIPPESFVVSTWHENESLEEAMFFIKHIISHESHKLENIVFLHISSQDQSANFISQYERI